MSQSTRITVIIVISLLALSLSFLFGYSTGAKSGVVWNATEYASGNITTIMKCENNPNKNCYSYWLKRDMLDSINLHFDHYNRLSMQLLEIVQLAPHAEDIYDRNFDDVADYLSNNPVEFDCKDLSTPISDAAIQDKCRKDITRINLFLENWK